MINVHDAKTHFSKLLELAHAGQEIILTKVGKPYARLMPLAQVESVRKPGRVPEIDDSGFFEALPDDELVAWSGAVRPQDRPLRGRLAELAREVDALPEKSPQDRRTAEEALGYDEQGQW